MQKSLFRGYLTVGIALSCSVTVVKAKAASVPQSLAQRTPEQILIAQSAVDEDTNLKFESRGCWRKNRTEVACDVLITNLGNERHQVRFWCPAPGVTAITNAIDSSGTVYAIKEIHIGTYIARERGNVDPDIAPSIPTKVTFIFEIPKEVTELTALDLAYISMKTWKDKKMVISNIGTIAPQSNSAPPRPRVRPR
jgi:hypothetical protein